ncbi:putative bifunctional diguanylate cyclase/phosphodiesterase [Pseudoduganella danionis]|uniref:putative bifunctional diguanylate cyclase/phosphodiesterase n=1 Tax=Pseudoduganella danionis TaxID=1890295 RepID=UPI0035B3EF77
MTALFYFAAAVEMVVGISLLFSWHRNRTQAFARKLGLSFFGVAGSILAFALFQDAAIRSPVNLLVIPALASCSLYFLTSGVFDLMDAPLRGWRARLLALSLFSLMVSVALQPKALGSQTAVALIYLCIGLLATRVLRHKSRPHRLIGPLLLLLAVHPMISASGEAQAIMLQFATGAVLRTALGFAVLYVSLDLSATESLHASERFARLTEYSLQGVAIMTATELLYANPATLRIYGADHASRLTSAFLEETTPAEERQRVLTLFPQLLSGSIERTSWEGQRQRIDGSPCYLHFFAYRVRWDQQFAVCLMITDETERVEQSRALLHRATHDALTGLPNRGALMQRLHEYAQDPAGHPHLTLYLLNIDRFKLFNTAHGYSSGDEILKAYAQAIAALSEGVGQLYRIGIDEFILTTSLPADAPSLQQLEQQLLARLQRPLQTPLGEFYVDTSIGQASYPADGALDESLLRAGNAAMHVAKRHPGSNIVRAQASFEQGSSDMLTLEQALRAGIRERHVYLCYQPKVDAASQRLIGFEALARWHRPGIGMVNPQVFIAAAETTGLIAELGTLLLRSACQQQARWLAAGKACVPIAVNVSPLQLLNPQFPRLVLDMLQEFQLAPRLLTLEITESAAVENLEHTCAQLRELRNGGIHIAIDDFGTGFSSLSMLRNLPLDTVKIDKALIDPLPGREGMAIVEAICKLATVLGLAVVAEGVETQEQAAAARLAGCDELQGYCFGKPMNPEDAVQLLG